ncbi:TetR/AcrR family transcriptional regulator [Yinghuangia sp. YIM S10712]|uniref:TetR/AcrR family transcriptional regulator n=1 Tax=Yinghuangia sp. YIM S10712 TaxID=3436930 RepID=UPI003F537C2F
MAQEAISARSRSGPGPAKRRKPGRPTREEAEAREGELLDVALELFLEHGYNLVTVEMVATEVGMTRRTIYARYPHKTELFAAAVQRAIERHILPLESLQELDGGDLAQTLEDVARLRIGQLMSPHGVRLQRIINTESYRFPEIFTANAEQSSRVIIEFVAGVFDRAVAAGEIAPTSTRRAAAAFMSLVIGGLMRTVERGSLPPQAEVDKHVRFTVGLLLDGLRGG